MLEHAGSVASSSYTSVARWLHWGTAILVISMVIFGWSLDGFEGQPLAQALSYHALGGFLIVSLTVLRYLWRVSHPIPALPSTISRPQAIAAKVIHLTLYVLMIIVPVTGLATAVAHDVPVVLIGGIDLQDTFAFLGHRSFEFRRFVHAQAMHILVALVFGHVGAALVHQFWFKDDIVRRMLRETRQ